MKKQITILFLFLCVSLINITAKDKLSEIMSELSKSENAMHQIIDKNMIDSQFNQSDDSTKASNLPPFIKKIEEMEVVIIQVASENDNKLINKLAKINDENYTSLIKVKDENSDMQILSNKNNENSSDIYIIVSDEGAFVMVKMKGKLSEKDIEDIIKEQTKNMNKAS